MAENGEKQAKKYKLIKSNIAGLFRIQALIDFNDVKKGDIGGYVGSKKNLSHYGNAWVYGNAKVYGNAEVYGNACVYGNAEVSSDADYIVFKNFWSSGRYFTWTRSNNMWRVGCFYGKGDELIEKAYKDSEMNGREYERVVRYVNDIIKDRENGK